MTPPITIPHPCIHVHVANNHTHLLLVYIPFIQAYSLYDREVGYCQGSLFLAGELLMHVSILGMVIVYKYIERC